MKILLVGFGSIGRRHFRNLLELGEQDILFCRTDRSTLDDSELQGYPVFHDLQEALDQDPEGVIISNPTAYHLEAAIPAARRGAHLLIEKPIAHSWERVEEFSRIVKESGSRVLVGYQFRYHPNLLQIEGLLKEEVIGKPLAVRSHWGEYLPAWHPWEDYRQSYSAKKKLGGGVILTLSHTFDYLRWLLGDAKVYASLRGHGGQLGIDVEDTAEVLLEFQEDLIGSVHLNYLENPPQHTLEMIGTRGKIFWDYFQNRVDVVSSGEEGQVREEAYFCPQGFDRNDLFLKEMGHFLEIIQGSANPICTLEDGIAALRLALEALQ